MAGTGAVASPLAHSRCGWAIMRLSRAGGDASWREAANGAQARAIQSTDDSREDRTHGTKVALYNRGA